MSKRGWIISRWFTGNQSTQLGHTTSTPHQALTLNSKTRRFLKPRVIISLGAFLLLAVGALSMVVHHHTLAAAHQNLITAASSQAIPKTPATQPATPTPTTNNATNVQVNSQNSSSSQSGTSSSADVTVNGQHQHSDTGNIQEHYSSNDGSTNVNVSVTSNSQTGGSSTQ